MGKWNIWYSGLREPEQFGDTTSYELAASWLAECHTIGDWGCGKGGFARYVEPPRQYFGFDGSTTPFAHQIVDLADFRFETEGVVMRHVIEHDYRWKAILGNASRSYTKRMVLILFTPMIDSGKPEVKELAFQDMGPLGGVPDLSFSVAAIRGVVPDNLVKIETVASGTQYHSETLLFYER